MSVKNMGSGLDEFLREDCGLDDLQIAELEVQTAAEVVAWEQHSGILHQTR